MCPSKSNTPTNLGGQPSEFTDAEQRLARLLGDQYELIRRIGSGGMGAVYKADHKQLDQLVAVKIVRDTAGDDANSIKRLKNEAQALAALDHPNIVKVFNLQLLEGQDCALIMEYVEGRDLATVFKDEGQLRPGRLRHLLAQCASALEEAHRQGIVHRDLKPANILVVVDESGSEKVKILDFGLAKLADTANQKLTRTGSIMGTPAYMSPEQCLAQSVDGRSDIYSLGCVFYEALSGKPPFEGDSAFDVMIKHTNERVPKPETYDASFVAIIEKCTQREPSQRFQSATQIIEALKTPVFRLENVAPREKVSAVRSKRAVVVAALVAVLVCILFAVWYFAVKPTQQTKGGFEVPPMRIGEIARDMASKSEEPGPEFIATINAHESKIEGKLWKVIGDMYYNSWQVTHKEEMRNLAIEAYTRTMDDFKPKHIPAINEAPKIALMHLYVHDVENARNVLNKELSNTLALPHRQPDLELKSYFDLLALNKLVGDQKEITKSKKLISKFDSDTQKRVLANYGDGELISKLSSK